MVCRCCFKDINKYDEYHHLTCLYCVHEKTYHDIRAINFSEMLDVTKQLHFTCKLTPPIIHLIYLSSHS